MKAHYYKGTLEPPGYPFYGYGDHLYTSSEEEVRDAQDRWGYEYEGIAGYVAPRESPYGNELLRYSNPDTPCGDHYYHMGRDPDAVKAGYNFERVECKVFYGPGNPEFAQVIRLYLPWNGDHFYSGWDWEIKNARDNHGYIDDDMSAFPGPVREANAFAVFSHQSSRPYLIPLHRLVRTKRWE